LANYVKFDEFVKDKDGKIIGAKLQDLINDEHFEVECKVAINCAGVHADTIR
jgi:glycerol-3-phosphate dehydrogenase